MSIVLNGLSILLTYPSYIIYIILPLSLISSLHYAGTSNHENLCDIYLLSFGFIHTSIRRTTTNLVIPVIHSHLLTIPENKDITHTGNIFFFTNHITPTWRRVVLHPTVGRTPRRQNHPDKTGNRRKVSRRFWSPEPTQFPWLTKKRRRTILSRATKPTHLPY